MSTMTKTSYKIPISHLIDRSAIINFIDVGTKFTTPNWSHTKRGIKLILAPKSHNACPNSQILMVHRMVNAPGHSFLWLYSLLI